MNVIDYIILLIVIIAFLLGYKDGLVRKLIGILGFFVGIYASFKLSGVAGELISPIFNDDLYLSEIIAGILIFLLVILLVAIVKRVVHPVDKVNRLFNQILGGISGAIQAFFFISGFLLLLKIFNIPAEKERKESLLYHNTYIIVPSIIDYIIGNDNEKKEFLKDLIEKSDNDSLNIDNYINKNLPEND